MLWHAQTMLEMSCFCQKIFFTDLTSSRFHETVNPRNVRKHRNFLAPHTQGALRRISRSSLGQFLNYGPRTVT